MESTAESGERKDRTDLNRLLVRLDPEPAAAWDKYESLRRRLVKFFEWNRCASPQELADQALDRVARKPAGEEICNVAQFVIGVARNIRLEAYSKSQREAHLEDHPGGSESLADPRHSEREMIEVLDQERSLACLRGCLNTLGPGERALALDYYSAHEVKQKDHRRNLATAAGVTMTALRVRANRVREKLEHCVTQCLESRRGMHPRETIAAS